MISFVPSGSAIVVEVVDISISYEQTRVTLTVPAGTVASSDVAFRVVQMFRKVLNGAPPGISNNSVAWAPTLKLYIGDVVPSTGADPSYIFK